MGEHADDLVDGFVDFFTGEFLDGKSPGYPRSRKGGRIEGVHSGGSSGNPLSGLRKFIQNHTSLPGDPTDHIQKYAEEKNIKGDTMGELAENIQKNFAGFRDWCRAIDPSRGTKYKK